MDLKKLMPSKTYVLTTSLSVNEVNKRIVEIITADRNVSFFDFVEPMKRKYRGKLVIHGFSIHQVTAGRRNSFTPLFTGAMRTENGLTRIDIKMELLPSVKIFMALWLGAVGLACVFILFVTIIDNKQFLKGNFHPFTLIPFALFLFGCYLPFAGFQTESEQSRHFLIKLLEGQEEGA